jgi:hypothetical protein
MSNSWAVDFIGKNFCALTAVTQSASSKTSVGSNQTQLKKRAGVALTRWFEVATV